MAGNGSCRPFSSASRCIKLLRISRRSATQLRVEHRQMRGATAAVLLAAALGVSRAPAAATLPWGSFNLNNSSCPIVYPFSNESSFCHSVGRQRAVVSVGATSSKQVACATLPWRRRDDPSVVGCFVQTSSGTFVPSVIRKESSTHTSGQVCFTVPASDTKQNLAVYWLPYAWSFNGGSGSVSPAASEKRGLQTARLNRSLHPSTTLIFLMQPLRHPFLTSEIFQKVMSRRSLSPLSHTRHLTRGA